MTSLALWFYSSAVERGKARKKRKQRTERSTSCANRIVVPQKQTGVVEPVCLSS